MFGQWVPVCSLQPHWRTAGQEKRSITIRKTHLERLKIGPRYITWIFTGPTWPRTELYEPDTYYYSLVCLTTGPKPLPKRFLHIVRSKASSFKWEYPLLSLRSWTWYMLLETAVSRGNSWPAKQLPFYNLLKHWPDSSLYVAGTASRAALCITSFC